MVNIISSGGLGDSFIVYLKILQILQKEPNQEINWKHYESNEIIPKLCNSIYNGYSTLYQNKIKCRPIFDKDYIQTINKERDKDIIYLNTSVNGQFDFPGKDVGLINPFLQNRKCTERFEYMNQAMDDYWNEVEFICLQTEAGAKGNRLWRFPVLDLFNQIQKKENMFVINNSGMYTENFPNYPQIPFEITQITNCIDKMRYCKLFIGIGGFWTYFCLANKIPTIYFSEGEEHEKHYIHPGWNQYAFKCKYGSLKEVMDGLRHFGYIL